MGQPKLKLRDYQEQGAQDGWKILVKHRILYIHYEVRTGKTLTSLRTCQLLQGKQTTFNVLFITKKKAIQSIKNDAVGLRCGFNLEVTNYESLHKVKTPFSGRFDVVICDEAHCMGGFPKPSKRVTQVKEFFDEYTYYIMLSGTMFPESRSQVYHQFAVSPNSPFRQFKTFYKWAKHFVEVYQIDYGYGKVNQYDRAKNFLIDRLIKPYVITRTQEQSGFKSTVQEIPLYVKMKDITYASIQRLRKDRVIEGAKGTILADTGVKLQQKVHQMYSGTVKYEQGHTVVFDKTKAEYIRDQFKGKKIAIFYYYKAEYDMLKSIFPDHTDVPEVFNEGDLPFIGQIRSCREGINLSTADCLIFVNIEFSCVSYMQAKDRMTAMDRKKDNMVYYLFAEGGIEEKIYEAVKNKEDYTLQVFKKDFGLNYEQQSIF